VSSSSPRGGAGGDAAICTHGDSLETHGRFLQRLAKGTTQKELTELAKQEGYLPTSGSDGKARSSRSRVMTASPAVFLHGALQNRWTIDVISFTAAAKAEAFQKLLRSA